MTDATSSGSVFHAQLPKEHKKVREATVCFAKKLDRKIYQH